MNAGPNSYPDKTARHESISRLRNSSAFIKNEYFGKIRRELRSERKQKNKDGSFMSRCFVRVSIYKQRNINLQRQDMLTDHQ